MEKYMEVGRQLRTLNTSPRNEDFKLVDIRAIEYFDGRIKCIFVI